MSRERIAERLSRASENRDDVAKVRNVAADLHDLKLPLEREAFQPERVAA